MASHRRPTSIQRAALALLALGLNSPGSVAAEPTTRPIPAAAQPFTRLFDTGAHSGPPTTMSDRPAGGAAWTLVPEDDLTHKFEGDAAILNDRLAGTGEACDRSAQHGLPA